MSYHLNLGLAFVDSRGQRHLDFQLVNDSRKSVATASYETDIPVCRRFICADSLPARQRHDFRALTEKLAGKETVKSLAWAYPNSDNARAFGFPNSGCWTVQLGIPGTPYRAVRAFAPGQFDYALSVVRQLPFPWCALTLRIHPEYAQS